MQYFMYREDNMETQIIQNVLTEIGLKFDIL